MIARARLVLALALFGLATPLFASWQVLALASRGWMDPRPAPRLWHAFVLRLLGMRVTVHGTVSSRRPLLLAANHVSWTDIMVLGSLGDVHFIAKAEVAAWPVLGFLSRLQRTLFVDRAARRQAAMQAGAVAARLSDGDPMVLFAEGTTSDGNRVLPFNASLFGAAQIVCAAGGKDLAIQPVAIAYTHLHGVPMGRVHRRRVAWIGDMTLLPHMARLLREGAVDVELRLGEPIVFAAGASRKDVARQVEEQVRRMKSEALAGRAGDAIGAVIHA